jgi:hypothetical protein
MRGFIIDMLINTTSKMIGLVLTVVCVVSFFAGYAVGQPPQGSSVTVLKSNQVPPIPPPQQVAIRQKAELLVFNVNASSWTLNTTPLNNTVPELIRNGVVQTPSLDYTISGNVINLIYPLAWDATDVITCRYFY